MRILSCLFSRSSVAATSGFLQKIVSNFPDGGNLSLAFGYGSGIFKQTGQENLTKNMLDFVFVVQDPEKFHRENLERNKDHYSHTMQKVGATKIAEIQEKYGANVFYNTLIKCEGRLIKYGVISNANLQNDLLNWVNLYIAGRLHKPVYVIHQRFEKNLELMLAMRKNLLSAVYTSFLMLPETFSEWQLYYKIAELSYLGDFRMKFGEDKNKVSNIVESNYSHFQELYHPVLQSIVDDMKEFIIWEPKTGLIEVDSSPKARHMYLEKMPLRIQIRMAREFDKNANQIRDTEEILRNIARYADIEDPVRDSIIYTVKRSARAQSAMSLIGVGPIKGLQYSVQKLAKMWKSLKKTGKKK